MLFLDFLCQKHRENSVLFDGHALNVLFAVKPFLGIFFGVSLLLFDPNLSFSEKEPNYIVKTALFRQNKGCLLRSRILFEKSDKKLKR